MDQGTWSYERASAQRTPAQRPLATVDLPHVSRLPIFPKQTQLQNSTLSIQTPVSTVCWVAKPPSISKSSEPASAVMLRASCLAGVGMISGLKPISNTEPVNPTKADSRNPGFERSMSHHRSGFTSANVIEICKVEDQASLRYVPSLVYKLTQC